MSDPKVTLLGMLTIQLLHLGLLEQASVRLQQTHDRARQLGQPMARLVALWFDALAQVRLDDVQRLSAVAEEMHALVDKFGLAQGRTASRWFRAYADARMGKPHDAHRMILEAFEKNTGLGMVAGGSETLGYAAEALLLAGDCDGAQEVLLEALQFASKHDERIYLPQLLLTEGAIARARGEARVADAAVRRAIAEATEQEAPWLELLARVELCEHRGTTPEDWDVLAGLVDRLPGAIGTAALEKALALLGGMKRRPLAA